MVRESTAPPSARFVFPVVKEAAPAEGFSYVESVHGFYSPKQGGYNGTSSPPSSAQSRSSSEPAPSSSSAQSRTRAHQPPSSSAQPARRAHEPPSSAPFRARLQPSSPLLA
jgi:hypothetical protein